MKVFLNISMFFMPATFIYMIHIRTAKCKGGGYAERRKALIFLWYFFLINVCTFLVSCARGIGWFRFDKMTVSYRLKYMGLGMACGLLFWMISLLPKFETKQVGQRNYELDFLKLFFAICVFVWHTDPFRNENIKITFPLSLGGIPVHFFFVVSGMLMANSILKRDTVAVEYGKNAVIFVIDKIKSMAWEVYAALFLFILAYVFMIPVEQVPETLIKAIPEIFFVTRAGIDIIYNGTVWYLSAMFLCMLPLSYLLYKDRDFTVYILAPILAVFTMGYFCQTNNYSLPTLGTMYGPVLGSIYRAVCGLCFGICAYNMYIRLYKANLNKNIRMFLTFTEVFLYGVFFGTWFLTRDNQALMSVILILPIAVAITFSGKSHIVKLFQFKWMKCFAPLSLKIYLNHWIGRVLVQKYFAGYNYRFCVCMMMFITFCSCVLSTFMIKIGKYIWKKKLKMVLTN